MVFLSRSLKEGTRTKIIVFVLLFIFSLSGFYRLGSTRVEELEKLMENVLHAFLIISADGISVGYFQWDEMYNAVISDDAAFFNENKADILSTFSSVQELEVVKLNFDGSAFYTVDVQGDALYLNFGVFDSLALNYAPDKMIRGKIDIDAILGHALNNVDMKIQNVFIAPAYKNVESLEIQMDEYPLELYHILSATMIGFLGVLFLDIYKKYTISQHYEVEGLANIVMLLSTKDAYTAEHSKDVADYAKAIASSLGMSRAKQKILEKAGYLHDIGKIGISESVLNKPGKLTAEEFERIQEHSSIGYEIVSQFPHLSEVALIVKHHHELLDGTGYPEGLMGNAIPLTAQILSVADVYSALTTVRPYRSNYSREEAFSIMEKMPLNQELVELLKYYTLQSISSKR